jgi:four helix bundle protein
MKDEERQDLRRRTKAFALRIIRLYTNLPRTVEAQVLGKQMLRAGTSVGSHYREACRARSDAEVISKLEGALQELDETEYWLELLSESGIVLFEGVKPLHDEAEELIAIFVSIVLKVKNRGHQHG